MNFDVLPRGITGFRDRRDPSLPQIDLRLWKKSLWDACLATNYSIECFSSTPIWGCGNYFAAKITRSTDSIIVLANAHYPLAAFAAQSDPPLTFLDDAPLSTQFKALTEWTILSQNTASSAPSATVLGNLSKSELKEIRHWNPTSVGEIVFNVWD